MEDEHYREESFGTILEAAFVDPAYQWPPPDGEGKNAIELQASITLLDDNNSIKTTESQKERMTIPPKPKPIVTKTKQSWWKCCQSTDAAMIDVQEYEEAKRKALQARKEHYLMKKKRSKDLRKRDKYNRVPEGILIYQLDTSNQTLTLMSSPHEKTDLDTLVTEMVVAMARPSPNKSRRGMVLTGLDGTPVTLVACEQRTAIAWLEAMDLMLANENRLANDVSFVIFFSSGL